MRKKPYVAGFDSSSAMMRVIGNFLHGKDFPNLGLMPAAMEPIMRFATGLVNRLPSPLRPPIYIAGTVSETVSPRTLGKTSVASVTNDASAKTPVRPHR